GRCTRSGSCPRAAWTRSASRHWPTCWRRRAVPTGTCWGTCAGRGRISGDVLLPTPSWGKREGCHAAQAQAPGGTGQHAGRSVAGGQDAGTPKGQPQRLPGTGAGAALLAYRHLDPAPAVPRTGRVRETRRTSCKGDGVAPGPGPSLNALPVVWQGLSPRPGNGERLGVPVPGPGPPEADVRELLRRTRGVSGEQRQPHGLPALPAAGAAGDDGDGGVVDQGGELPSEGDGEVLESP